MPTLALSIFYVVKNEIFNLPKSLHLMKQLDPAEIIILDTGSKDGTYEWAKSQFPKTTYRHKWKDDFGEAKTAALKKCTQPWVLEMDADEFIDSSLFGNLSSLLKAAHGVEGFALPVVNFLQSPFHISNPRIMNGVDIRLFRNLKNAYYDGYIHEQLKGIYKIYQVDKPILFHLQYKSRGEDLKNKMEYYKKLMDKKTQKYGWNYLNYVHMSDIYRKLYMEFDSDKDYMECIRLLKMAIIANPKDDKMPMVLKDLENIYARRQKAKQAKKSPILETN